ncbi:MAG: LamG-like jellyroll fold domain-containing protein [Cyclobacteriaceae bacterium]
MMDKYFANLHKKTFASLLIGLMLSSFSVFAAPPTNTVPGTISASKNKALRITNGLSVDDTDLDNLTVTLTVTNGGQLFLGTTVGLTVNDGDGTDGSVQIFGDLTSLNNALADLTFINETTATSSIFVIQSNDGGGNVNNNFTINLNNDNSLAFAGDDDVMSIPSGGAFFTGGTFTYEAWILIVNDGSPQWEIFEFSNATSNVIYINSSGQVIAEDTNGGLGGRLASDVGAFPIDGNWHHLAIVDDGTNPEVIYVDGAVVGIALDNFTNFNTSAGTSNILVGDRASIAGYEFSGQIDELRVWSVGRSASEIANNKDNALVGNEPGLEAYYRLDQGTAGGSNVGVNNATNNDDSGGSFNAGLTGFALTGTTSNWVYGQNYFPSVNTDPASAVLSLSATLGGNITDQGGNVITERGVVYAVTSTNDLPVIGGTGVTKEPEGSVGTGTFSENISGLTLSTNYTFRAYSMNVAGTSYGNTQTFTTQSFTAPIISTSTPASGRTSVSAIVAGNISSDGGQPITERGFVYSVTTLDADPLIGDPDAVQVIDPMTTTGNYTKKLEGLTPGETYSYKAYATNSQGTSYGNAEQFVLADSPTFLPGDLAFTMTNGDAASAFAVVALKTIPSGTVIHFTDKGYDVDVSDFFTAEGIVSFTAGTTIFTGDQILIDPNGAGTATLKSGGSAGSIVETGTFLIDPSGDNIFAFQGIVNSNTNYAIGGFVAGLLTDFSSANMNVTTSWTLVADDVNESEIPTSLTNADNAVSLFPGGNSTSPFHRYNYSTVTGLAHEVRLEINNLANWNRNQASAANMATLGTFNINSPPIVTVPGDQIIDDVTTVVFSGAELVSVADNDGHDQTVVVTATNNGNFSNSTGTISVVASGAIVNNNNTSSVTISGTLTDVNATLDGMQYVPGGIAGQHQITVSSDDGNTGTDSKIILVNVSGTFDVGTNTADTGLGSFREALNDANLSGATADVIEFTGMTGGVITLASDLPSIAGTVTINGPGARDLTIDGVFVYKLIRSSTPVVDLEINDLTLMGGSNITTNNRGGAISVDGINSLKATGLHITNNQAYTDGGGIYLNTTGSSSISGCLIENNFLASATPDDRKGGGIYLDSDCNISNTTIYNNTAVEGGGVYANFGIHAFKHMSIASNQVYLNLIGAGTDVTLEYSIIEDLTINPGSGQVSAANVVSHIFSTSGGTVLNASNVTSGSVDAILGTIVNQGGNTNVLQISGINLVNAAIGSAEGFDQIGNARPNGADVDLGAYERDPVSPKFEVTWLDNNPADGVVDRAQLDFDVNVIFKDANAGAANFDAFSLSGGAFNTAETDFGTATYKNINTFTVDVTGLVSGTSLADFPTITYNDSGEISVVSFDTGDQMVNASTPTTTNDAALPIITGISLDPNNTFVDVTFSEPVFTDLSSSALLASDFTLSVTGGMASLTNTTPTGITDLGSNVYQLTFDLDQPASGTETLTVNLFDGMAVYDAAGNPASGTQTNNTVVLNDKLLPYITKTVVAADNSNIEVTFNEPVFNTTGGSGALETTDFTISVSGGVAGFSGTPDAITPLGGNTYQLDFTLSPPLADGNEVLTVNPADGSSIFDAADNNALATQSNNTVSLNDKLPPTITNTIVAPDNTFIDVTFSEPVFTDLASGALVAGDFTLSVTGGVANVVSPTPTGITPQGGNIYRLTFTLDALPNGAETLTVNPVDGVAIFDGADNPAAASQSNNEVALNDQAPPFITGVTLDPNNTFVDVAFSEPVFNATGGSGALEEVDFVLSISGGVASLVSSIPTGITDQGSNVYRLTFDLDQAASGTETLTVNLIDGASVFDGADNAASATQANNSILLNDKLLPFITKTTVAADNSNIEVTFNEPVFNTNSGSGGLQTSDFVLSVSGGVSNVASPTPTGITYLGGNVYQLDFTLNPALASGAEVLTVNPSDGASIFDGAGNGALAAQSNNTVNLNDKLPGSITNTIVAPDNTYIDVDFSEPVFTDMASGTLLADDFTLSVTGGVANVVSPTPTGITPQGGNIYRLTFTLDALPNGAETLTVNPVDGAAIFDGADNASAASQSNNAVSLNDQVLPFFTGVTLASDNSYIDVAFNEPAFTTNSGGALIAGDFTLSVSGGSSTLLSPTPNSIADQGGNVYRLTFTLIGLPNGAEVMTVNPVDGAAIFDAVGNAAIATQSNNTASLNDQQPPTINTSTFDATSNKQLSITVNVDEIATLYYSIYTTQQAGGSPAPADIKNAANTPDFSGSFSVPTANVDVTGFAVESFIDNQQYYTYIVAEDGSSNLSTVVEDVRTMFDTDPPFIISQSPENIGVTSIDLRIELDEDATIYFIARSLTGLATPTHQEVIDGIDGSDVTGSGVYTAGSTQDFVISGLANNTAYDIFWFAEDGSAGANRTDVQEINSATSADATAPIFNSFSTSNLNTTSVDINVDLDDVGTIFYVFQLNGEPVPSNAQVVSGAGAPGATVQQSGSFTVGTANVIITESVNFLPADTNMDLYVVAADAANNTRIAPVYPEDVITPAVAALVNITVTAPTVELCVGEDFVPLGTVAIIENNTSAGKDAFLNNNTTVTLKLTLPDGIEFNTAASVSVTESGNDDFASGPTLTSLTTSAITITYRINGDGQVDDITITGLEVKGTQSGASGSLQRLAGDGGTATIDGNNPGDGVSHANVSVGVSSAPPAALVVTYCEGDVVQLSDFTTNSANFTWYTDFNLTLLEHTGEIFDPETDLNFDVNVPDTYSYFVTNTSSGSCPSSAAQVDVIVNPTPVADAGLDQVECAGVELLVGGLPSLVSTGAVGTHTYQWRSEPLGVGGEVMRALDEDFDSGTIPPTGWSHAGTSASGNALAFDGADALVIPATGGNIVSPSFGRFDSKAVLFFYGRAETAVSNGAQIEVFGSDDGFTTEISLGTAFISSTKYKQFAIEIPADDNGGGSFNIRIEYDNSGGADENFIIDELILDKGITNATQAVKSNPFFAPPSNNAGLGDLVYDLVLTIVDPNLCKSTDVPNADDYTARITTHDKISPTISFQDAGGNTVAGNVGINTEFLNIIIDPPATTSPGNPDPGVEFTGTAISYNASTEFYEFSPADAGGGDFTITYTYTESDTGDDCEESIQTSISVVASLLDGLVLSNCIDVAPYDINPSQDMIDQLSGSGDSFVELRYPDNTTPLTFTNTYADPGSNTLPIFTFDPDQASSINNVTNGEKFGPMSLFVVTSNTSTTITQSVDVVPQPTVGIQVYDDFNDTFSAFQSSYCETDAIVQLSGIVRSTGDVSSSTVQLTDLEDDGLYEISSNGGASYTTLTDGQFDPSIGAGSYIIRYTNDIGNDPAVEGGAGCTNSALRAVTVFAQPSIPSLNINPNYASNIDPDLSASVTFGGGLIDNNGNDAYKFVYCEGESVTLIYADFVDADNNKVQDAGTEKYFRWYDDDGSGNPDFDAEIPVNTQSGGNTDRRIITQSDLFFGTPDPGTYSFHLTQTANRSPLTTGTIFAGCESTTRQIIIEVVPDPEVHDLAAASNFFDDVANTRQVIEYCETEPVQNIQVNLTTPAIGTDEIVWFDEFGTELFATTSATVTPVQLGLGTGAVGGGTTTPPVKSQFTNTATIEYTSSDKVPAFIIGEFAVDHTNARLQFTGSSSFVLGEEVTSASGGKATIIQVTNGLSDVIVNNISGFFPVGEQITGSISGVGQLTEFRRSGNNGFGIITNDDGSKLNINVSVDNFTVGNNLAGNTGLAQAYINSYTRDVEILPYTFYYARRDEAGLITQDASEGDFPGCDGVLTKVDIFIYPKPLAPEPDAVFDTEIYACVGNITTSTNLRTPEGLNQDKQYFWYENASGGSSFADNDITFSEVQTTGPNLSTAFDFSNPGTTTYYLSQIDRSAGASPDNTNITPGYEGCESVDRTPVNITLFAKPSAPTLTVTDDNGDPVSISSSTLPNSNVTYLVCQGEINTGFTFDAGTSYAGSNRHEFNWYTVNATTGALETFIGTFSGGATPDPSTDLGLVGATGAKYFGITQTTDIIDGEFVGCTSPAINVAFNIKTIPGGPTIGDPDFFLCFGSEVQTGDLTVSGTGSEAYWYSDPIGVGNPAFRIATTFDPDGTALGLSSTTAAGNYSYFVTQATDIDNAATPAFGGCETAVGSELDVIVHIEPIESGPTLLTSELNRTICEGENFTAVTVTSPTANAYQWYKDAAGTITIPGATGVSYLPTVADFTGFPQVSGGKFVADFSIYVGQFTGESDCPSTLTQVDMTVHSTPVSPITTANANGNEYEICQFAAFVNPAVDVAGLLAGEQYNWYSDAGLNNLVASGITFNITTNEVNPNVSGTTNFWVAKTENIGSPSGFAGCEGPATMIKYTVNPLPVLDLTNGSGGALPAAVCVDNGNISLLGSPANASGSFSVSSGLGLTDNGDGTATFDVLAAVGQTNTQNYLDQSEVITVTYTYTDANSCVNSINKNITINGLPSVDVSFGREGEGLGKNEFCIDDVELNLIGSPSNASGTFSNAINNSAIDNTVGNSRAEIDLLDAFETVNPAKDFRQVDYVVTYTYTGPNGCVNTTDITIKINNTPEPDFLIQRNGVSLTGSGGVDLEVCIDDISTSEATATDKIVLLDDTDPVNGTLVAGTFSGNASGVPLSAAALAKNSEGEYYFYPSQAVADAVAGNPVAFSNVTSIDFTIDYTFTNDLTCSGSASAFGKTKKIRVYRLPQPVIKIDDGAALDENDYCIDHDVSGDPVRLFVQSIGFDTGDGFGGTFVSDPPLSNAALYSAGVSGGRDEIFFDPAVAYAESGLNSANEEVATFSITYEYATSDIGCTATSGAVTLVVNPLPVFDFTYRQAGATADNEVCVDEGTLTVVSSDPESGGAIATFSLVGVPQTAIDDNNDGTADIDIEQLFKDASATTGFTERQISVDVNLQYQDAKGCANNVVQTIVIHNLPVPEMDVARNDASASLVTGTRDGSGNLLVELCIDDLSTSEAGSADKILISDITDQASQGTFVSASFSELSFGLNGANDGLENNGDGTAFFYPAAAMARADNNPAFRTDTFIDFVIDMSYENDNGCSGKALAQSSANGVQDIDNTVTIRVYRSPNPTIKINNNGNIVSSAAVCIVDGNTNANEVTIFREGIQFNQNGVLGGAGSYTLDPALSSAAFSAPTGINDEAILNSQLAYNEFGNGSDPLVVTITYTYSTDKSCGQTSNAVTVTINPLPTVDFVIPEGPVAANVNEFCIDNANISLNASAFEGTGSVSAGGSGLFSTQFGASGLTTVNGFQAQFNFESAYETAQGDGSEPIQNVTYTFTDNRGCIGKVTKQITINTKPVVQIDTEGGCDDAAVEFQFSTVPNDPNNPQTTDPGNPITSVTWDFDDKEATDEDNTSNEFSPSHAYVEAGNYAPSLFVENDRGCVSTVVTRDIVVGEIPDVNFTVQGLCFTDEIVYTASPQSLTFGTIDSLLFDYGDMNIDSIKVVSQQDFVFPHTYQEPGTYDVALSLITNNKCNRVITRSVTILPVETAPYFNDFEVLNESDTVKVKFYKQEEVNGIRKNVEPEQSELEVVSMDGWYVDLRPIEDKEDPEGDWGKLPSEFNSWQYGIPSGALVAAPGANNHAWATNLDGNYINNESRSWVYSPCFDFTSLTRPMVSFDQIFHFSDQRDGVVLQYSIDGGSEWVALGDYEPFTDDATGTEWFTNENITGKPGQQELQASNEGDIGWAGNLGANTAQWVSARHKLDGILPADRSSVIFRFALGSDGSAASEGFAFDNFAIKDREKNVLLEQFSSTNVTASATVDASINAIIDDPTLNNGDIIRVNYHTTFKGDLDNLDTSVTPAVLTNPDPVSILNIEDPSARAVFYGISAAPTSLINGEVNRGATARTEVPWTLNNLARRSLDDALFNIVVDPNFGSDQEVLDVSVNITASQDVGDDGDATTALPEKEIIVYIAVVEKTVVMSNAANGQLETRAALRKMLPNGIGTREPRRQYPIGTSVSVNESWEIQKGLDGPDLAVVVFVQDIETKNVYQTVSVDVVGKVSPTITGIDDGFDGRDYSLYPNPASKEVFVLFDQMTTELINWTVYDQTGKIYKYGKLKPGAEGFGLDTREFPSGMYFISINGENLQFRNKKLMIAH